MCTFDEKNRNKNSHASALFKEDKELIKIIKCLLFEDAKIIYIFCYNNVFFSTNFRQFY
jgi:meiotically up-regulated gene 157 (Mug157) protein